METIHLPTPKAIFEAYQQVLINSAHLLPFGVPEGLLPCERDQLRQVIRSLANRSTCTDIETFARHEDLRTAYLSLASFVSYEDANIAARLQHALERNQFAFLASPEAEAARQLSRRIEREAAQLAREFDAWASEESDPVLREVNSVLIEFERKRTAAPR